MNKNVYNSPWFVYIAECKDKTLYTGIALDAKKRIKAHNTTNQCRYTRFRKPLKLVYQELYANQNSAFKRELEIKSFTRNKKLELIKKFWRGAGAVERACLENM
ncbi:MAG: GIY-YIG nuclease family protein [Candidatus Omnitrophica bacterium]|nr:GIY-YIG nuclease family protein [Candidatus Omnitrophota bacterium]